MATNDSFQNQNPLQKMTFKIIRGVIFRLVLIIALPIILSKMLSKVPELLSIELPGWVKPVVVISSIILGIAMLVHYLVTQFIMLKTGFQNLEQTLATSVPQEAIEYTELPNMQQVNMKSIRLMEQW